MAAPRYGFPAISVGPRGPKPDDDVEESLYEDTGGDWKGGARGEEIGTVRLTHERTETPGRVNCTATFRFGDGAEAVYGGLVPGNGSWKGKGRFERRSGPDRFPTQLDVDSTNPKRWG